MRKVIFLFVLVFSSAGAHAQSTCGGTPNPANRIRELCDHLNKDTAVYCKVDATPEKHKLPLATYGIWSAEAKMKSIFSSLHSMQNQFLTESKGCPDGCSRINMPVVEISTMPTGLSQHPSCPSEYKTIVVTPQEAQKFEVEQSSQGFVKKFFSGASNACANQASTFAQDTLMGDNSFGKHLEKAYCNDPCSYSSTIRLKAHPAPVGQCRVELELVILCGPPKKEREWKTQASITKAYRCEGAR